MSDGRQRVSSVRKPSVGANCALGRRCQDTWVCTLPPMNNWLRVPIRAGEKTYPGKESAEE